MRIEGWACKFDVTTSKYLRTHLGTFTKSLAERRPKMLFMHNLTWFKIPIGRWTHVEERDEGIYVKGWICWPFSRLVRKGSHPDLSIGFKIKRQEITEEGVRELFGLKHDFIVHDDPAMVGEYKYGGGELTLPLTFPNYPRFPLTSPVSRYIDCERCRYSAFFVGRTPFGTTMVGDVLEADLEEISIVNSGACPGATIERME